MNSIPYGKHEINDDDINAVVNVLKSDYLTQGPKVEEFEQKFAEYIGAEYAIAVSNGTAALHLCNLALNVKNGTKVLTTPLSFVATSNCVLYCSGEVDFCDIDPETLLIDINKLEQILKESPNGYYSGIIPVNFAGLAVKMDKIKKLADEYDLWIIEDACHAPGASFIDSKSEIHKCGDGVYSDLAIFSFHPVKHISCGEGGMITTNRKDLYDKIVKLRSHGITKNQKELFQNHGGWYYEMQDLGYNYRLSDISCSLGISQLKRASEGLTLRKLIVKKYIEELAHINDVTIYNSTSEGHAYHLCIIKTSFRDELYEYLKSKKIYCQIHYLPIHLQPYYSSLGHKKGDFPCAESYYETCISLPLFPSMKREEINYVIKEIKTFFSEKNCNYTSKGRK